MRESDRLPPRKDSLTLRKAMLFFGEWRTYFLPDADARAIHHVVEMKGDIAMRLFWERGTAPAVQAVLDRRMRPERHSFAQFSPRQREAEPPHPADTFVRSKLSVSRF
jgi:hypothetical protein